MADRELRPTTHVRARLTSDAEIRYTNSGKAVVGLRVAEVMDRDREASEGANFFTVSCWEQLAEEVCVLAKGMTIFAYGYWADDSVWITKDGEERATKQFSAFDVGVSVKGYDLTWTKVERIKPERNKPVVQTTFVDDGEPF